MPISSESTPERDGDHGKSAGDEGEVESFPPEREVAVLTRNAIGTSSTAPTQFRKKAFTILSESEKWQLADDCTEILMQRVWREPHVEFDVMKKASEDFLRSYKQKLVVSLCPVAPKDLVGESFSRARFLEAHTPLAPQA